MMKNAFYVGNFKNYWIEIIKKIDERFNNINEILWV
jgi:hypothetical protein